jgi:hypothetical protein
VLSVAATLLASVVPWGGAWSAAAVAGGAVLSLVRFWALRRGVTGLAEAVLTRQDETAGRAGRPRFLALFVLRYALLAIMAYVMIARLRLSPLGLLCGASVTMLAAAAELTRRVRPS